jgi:hypothetical protein
MRGWQNAEKYGNAKLVVVHNHDSAQPPAAQRQNIEQWNPDFYYPRKNHGQDIGALRDMLRSDAYDPWDILFWAVDDNIPMRKDFLRAFIQPFEKNPNLGLVGNYWVQGAFYPKYKHTVPDHFRTSCFAIRREAAMRLYFPTKLSSKWDCYAFEWLDTEMCMTSQIHRMGYTTMPVCNDWTQAWVNTNTYVWDVGCLHMRSRDPRCRKDHWKEWEAQFAEETK